MTRVLLTYARSRREVVATTSLAAFAALIVVVLLGLFPGEALSTGGYHDAVAADSPVGYWRLSEASGTTITDELGGGHSGSYSGAVTLGQTGPITTDGSDTAAYFNGGWGSIPYYSDLNPTGNKLSIEFWWKGTAPSAARFMVLKGYTSHSDPYYQYGVGDDTTGKVRVIVDTSGSFSPWDTGIAWPGDGAWHQIVVTYDGSLASNNLKLYIDAVQRAQTNKTGNVRSYSSALGLMDILNLGSGFNATGRLDDVSIYNSALSSTRISAHYDAATVTPPAAPTNSTLPSVTGTAIEGQTLTTDNGSWTGSPTSYAYQWRRCDSAGANCSDISGATGSSYTLVTADVGSKLRAVVTATNAGGSTAATSNATAVVLSSSASASYRQAATADNPVGYWRLSESSGSTITDELGAGHGGSYTGTVTLAQTGPITTDGSDTAAYFNGGWGSIPYYSDLNPTGNKLSLELWWKGAAPSGAQFAVLKGYTSHSDPYYQYGVGAGPSGTVRVVVDTSGSFNPWDTGVSWPGDGAWHQIVVTYDGSLASNNLKLYVDASLRAQINKTGNVRGYSSALGLMDILNLGAGYQTTGRLDEVSVYNSALSASRVTAHFAAAFSGPANTTLPSISGTPTEGETLAAENGSWTGNPTGYGYDWMRCDSGGGSCADVPTANASTYTLVGADVGKTLRVAVTATNISGSTTANSGATSVVAPGGPPSNTSLPTITGTASQDWTLTGGVGTWTEAPSAYARQWLRCDASGSSCTEIADATSGSLVLTSEDVGATVRFRVTASNSAGSASATSSASAVVEGLTAVDAPDTTIETPAPVTYNGPYISATQWIPNDDGGYELRFQRRSNGAWEGGVYPCLSFSAWPWNTCGNDLQTYDGTLDHYSFRKEVWDEFGPGSSSAGALYPLDTTCGDSGTGGQPQATCYSLRWYDGVDPGDPPVDDPIAPPGNDETPVDPVVPNPVSPPGVPSTPCGSEFWSADEVDNENGEDVITCTDNGTTALTGIVNDEGSGDPVSDATVTMSYHPCDTCSPNNVSTTTGAEGGFAFVNMAAASYTVTISAPNHGLYTLVNATYEADETYELTADVGPDPVTIDDSSTTADRPPPRETHPGPYYSHVHTPPTMLVGHQNRDDNCDATSDWTGRTRNYSLPNYVMYTILPEVGGLFNRNERAMKAWIAITLNYAWLHKTNGPPYDILDSTDHICFRPGRSVPTKLRNLWRGWMSDVFDWKMRDDRYDMKEAQFLKGSASGGCDQPGYEPGGVNQNITPQYGLQALVTPGSGSCYDSSSDWKVLATHYYMLNTRFVRTAKPPPPSTSPVARSPQGLTFSALSSSTGGKNVAWSYYFEVKRGTAWYRFMTLGWSRKAGAVKHSYFYPVSRMNLDDHPERRCAYYHVIAHNPRGDSAVVRFHDEQGRQLICVP
jgi:hypothetical protein